MNYRMKHDPKLTDKFDTTNQPGATSELWREASRIGGNLIQADWIQCGPWNSPEEKGMASPCISPRAQQQHKEFGSIVQQARDLSMN